MRIASYNVENLFDRAKVLASAEWSDARELLDAYTELTKVLQQQDYSAADKTTILRLLDKLGLKAADETALFRLRQNRGRLVRRSADGTDHRRRQRSRGLDRLARDEPGDGHRPRRTAYRAGGARRRRRRAGRRRGRGPLGAGGSTPTSSPRSAGGSTATSCSSTATTSAGSTSG